MKEAPEYLRRGPAADYLKSKYGHGSSNWLAKLAVTGGGPIYSKAGNTPLYLKSDLDKWMHSRMTRRASTSVELDSAPATPMASAKPSDAGAERKGNAPATGAGQSSEAAA